MSDRIEYPDDFIDAVITEYSTHPDLEKMRRMLRAGDLHALGKLLHAARSFDGTAARIHRILYEGRHRELEREAAIADRRERIYARWYVIYETAKKQQ